MTESLPRLPPTPLEWGSLQVYWQQLVEATEGAINDLEETVSDQSTTLALLVDQNRRISIAGSYTIPTLSLTATDAGANVTVTIASHTRVYADGSQLSVTGSAITGLNYSTVYAVYYDDETRGNETPTFVATTNLGEAQANYSSGRHYVGTVSTPAALGAPSTGGAPPPGSGYTAGSGGIAIP